MEHTPLAHLITSPSNTAYALRLADCASDLQAAQRLRYEVFNLEIHEGLEASHAIGRDADPFDEICDHILVEHKESGQVVGTYRCQTGAKAEANLGYYSEQEFDFRPFEPIRREMVELGRACVAKEHRNLFVLGLLWRGIAAYALERGGRYLCGCSSLTSQDPTEGASAFEELSRRYLALPQWRTTPLPEYFCSMDRLALEQPKIPKLLRAYLGIGAKICGPPALDIQFKTIDFLTLMDLQDLSESDRARFLTPSFGGSSAVSGA